jgi:hypothetical protein
MLNNKGPDPVEVRPILFAINGNHVQAAPIIVAGESFRNVDLGELGAISGTIFEEGSLQLTHKGPGLVIGAQLYIVNESRSLSLDEKLVEFQGVPSTQLEGVWWMPPHSNVDLILSNTSDNVVTAEVKGMASTRRGLRNLSQSSRPCLIFAPCVTIKFPTKKAT